MGQAAETKCYRFDGRFPASYLMGQKWDGCRPAFEGTWAASNPFRSRSSAACPEADLDHTRGSQKATPGRRVGGAAHDHNSHVFLLGMPPWACHVLASSLSATFRQLQRRGALPLNTRQLGYSRVPGRACIKHVGLSTLYPGTFGCEAKLSPKITKRYLLAGGQDEVSMRILRVIGIFGAPAAALLIPQAHLDLAGAAVPAGAYTQGCCTPQGSPAFVFILVRMCVCVHARACIEFCLYMCVCVSQHVRVRK